MHVGLNLVYLVPGETGGMETYARELIPALVTAGAPGIRFTSLVSREGAAAHGAPWLELIPSVTVPVSARRRHEWVFGEQWHLPRLGRASRIDVLHSLGTTAPLRGSFRRVTTIQDLIYKAHPEAHFGVRALGMRLLLPRIVQTSHRVIATSNATRADLVNLLGADPEVVDVVPLGPGSAMGSTPAPPSELRERLASGDREIVLSPSAKRPHKNLARLLDATALVDPSRRPVLVLPGYPTPHERELRGQAVRLRIAQDVRFLGWVSPEELEGLYAIASCVVVPSLYEGFGLPVLEAMQRGVPVACSGTGALAEVAGGAAVLFDPTSTRQIADAIELLLGDDRARERASAAGLKQAASFSWERTARETLEVYERTLQDVTRALPASGPIRR